LIRSRIARGGAASVERRPSSFARRESWRRGDADLASRLDDARIGAGRAPRGHRHHRRARPHLRRPGGRRRSEGRSPAGSGGGRTVPALLLPADKTLLDLVSPSGTWVYAILFGIVFAETGFVVTPFLPGDSLLFATGALCATGALSTPLALGLL